MVRYHRRGRLGCLFTVVAHVESRIGQKCPATIFLISGIFPLVPGAGIYWTVYYLITKQLRLAVYTGYEAVKVAIAIVLGIVVIFELPQGWFWWAVKK